MLKLVYTTLVRIALLYPICSCLSKCHEDRWAVLFMVIIFAIALGCVNIKGE